MASKFLEIKKRLPLLDLATIFDVGANVGQSVQAFREAAPQATIYAFEPVTASFAELQKATESDQNVRCMHLGLNDHKGTALMGASGTSSVNAISNFSGPAETIPLSTGTDFCHEHNISHINYLKIDTEGQDLNVCIGFRSMFERFAIDMVQVEAGVDPENTRHVPLQSLVRFFEPIGYRIFKFYSQKIPSRRPVLRRVDAVFISPKQIKLHPMHVSR
jgi:FkbM family methyltransferase